VIRKSEPSDTPVSTDTVVSKRSPMVISEVAASARRGGMMAAVAATGRIRSVARPLSTPPLAKIRSVMQMPSTASWNSACQITEGQRRWMAFTHTSPKAKYAAQMPTKSPGCSEPTLRAGASNRKTSSSTIGTSSR